MSSPIQSPSNQNYNNSWNSIWDPDPIMFSPSSDHSTTSVGFSTESSTSSSGSAGGSCGRLSRRRAIDFSSMFNTVSPGPSKTTTSQSSPAEALRDDSSSDEQIDDQPLLTPLDEVSEGTPISDDEFPLAHSAFFPLPTPSSSSGSSSSSSVFDGVGINFSLLSSSPKLDRDAKRARNEENQPNQEDLKSVSLPKKQRPRDRSADPVAASSSHGSISSSSQSSNDDSRIAPFNKLPFELIDHIFRFLTVEDMKEVSQVSRQFYTIANTRPLIRFMYEQRLNQTLQSLCYLGPMVDPKGERSVKISQDYREFYRAEVVNANGADVEQVSRVFASNVIQFNDSVIGFALQTPFVSDQYLSGKINDSFFSKRELVVIGRSIPKLYVKSILSTAKKCALSGDFKQADELIKRLDKETQRAPRSGIAVMAAVKSEFHISKEIVKELTSDPKTAGTISFNNLVSDLSRIFAAKGMLRESKEILEMTPLKMFSTNIENGNAGTSEGSLFSISRSESEINALLVEIKKRYTGWLS